MRSIIKACLLAVLMYAPVTIFAQGDSIRLACPFEHGSGKEPKQAYTWEPNDLKLTMISQVDTIVLSCITGVVSNVSPAEDGVYEIVVHNKNYYFWYFGVAKPLVKKGQQVTARQPIATYKLGSELEFRMFKFETPVDPRNLLECKVPKATD